MVRAKKEFEMEDLENMIAYFYTIKRKMELDGSKGPINKKGKKQFADNSVVIVSKRAAKKDSKSNLNRSFSDSQNSLSRSQSQASDSDS